MKLKSANTGFEKESKKYGTDEESKCIKMAG